MIHPSSFYTFSFLGWNECESNWHVGHSLASCVSPQWKMVTAEKSVEWLAGEAVVFKETLLQSRCVQTAHMTRAGLGRRPR
jgi:hypothetical protein